MWIFQGRSICGGRPTVSRRSVLGIAEMVARAGWLGKGGVEVSGEGVGEGGEGWAAGRVEDVVAVPVAGEQSRVMEGLQVFGDCGLGELGESGEFLGAAWLGAGEVQEFQAGASGCGAELAGKLVWSQRRGQGPDERVDRVGEGQWPGRVVAGYPDVRPGVHAGHQGDAAVFADGHLVAV